MTPRLKLGDRVRCTTIAAFSGVPQGSLGTIGTVPGFYGLSIHPDPSKMMTYVEWDDHLPCRVFTKHLEKVK